MEVVQVEAPTEFVDVVKPEVYDKMSDYQLNVSPIEAIGNNYPVPAECGTAFDPELVPHAEEDRPADVVIAPTSSHGGDTRAVVPEVPVSPNTSRLSEAAEVVTPAGTVEAPHGATDTPSTETVDKEVLLKKANEVEAPAHAERHKVQKIEPTVERKVEQHETSEVKPEATTPVTTKSATATEEPVASAPSSPSKKSKSEKKQANVHCDSVASEEVLAEVKRFLTFQIVENRCSSHSKEIHEFVEKHLDEKQRTRYIAPLVEQIVQNLTQEATAKGEEVSIDIQSNICLIEQMFLALGRRSPLQDMYTAEEEEMLDLLFHSNSSDNLPIDS